MGTKFQMGDRIRINEKLFPSYDEGLFKHTPKIGAIVTVEPGSILPYQVKIDRFEHHPFWFYEDQLLFEDPEKELAWAKANAPQPRKPTGTPPAAPPEKAP